MSNHVRRSIKEPFRAELSYDEIWHGADESLIQCWEVGRQLREKDPEIAARANNGELVTLPWKGGTGNSEVLPADKKAAVRYGTLRYLAMWQGLRGDDLDIELESQVSIACTRTRRTIIFDLNTARNLDL